MSVNLILHGSINYKNNAIINQNFTIFSYSYISLNYFPIPTILSLFFCSLAIFFLLSIGLLCW